MRFRSFRDQPHGLFGKLNQEILDFFPLPGSEFCQIPIAVESQVLESSGGQRLLGKLRA